MERKNVTAVGILQPDRLNFDKAKIAAKGGGELVGDKDFVLHQASVVRKGDAIVELNPLQERYRSSVPDKSESDTNAGGGANDQGEIARRIVQPNSTDSFVKIGCNCQIKYEPLQLISWWMELSSWFGDNGVLSSEVAA